MKDFRPNGELLHDFADNGWMDHTCSVCKYTENTDVHVHVDWKYCPRCGAKFVKKTPEEKIPKGFQEEIQEGQCLVSIMYKPHRVYQSGHIIAHHNAIYKCSLCDYEGWYYVDHEQIEEPVWNYCPECGAKLKVKFQGLE